MTRSKVLAGAAAVALLAALPASTLAQGRGGHGGGPAVSAAPAAASMGARGSVGGSPGASPAFAARAPSASFARTNAPTANFAATSPNVGARGMYTGTRTAVNGGDWRGGEWHGDHHHHGRFFPGAFAGAVVGGALAYDPYYYDDSYAYGPDYYYDTGPEVAVVPGGVDASYCAQRYRSWDPATGTYLGYDGQRHPCP